MFICKLIILFYDNDAQKNLQITYNNKLPHHRDVFDNRTDHQVSSKTTDQIYKRPPHSTQAEKLSYVLVIFKEIIDTFITSKYLN